ncbi:Rap1a/Tai family immunity protein [Comamonas koreensis]|uniref:Rap1a/Tai family immunity protein n=1 Tax=Comamonas koreensis TaxID=160825 RepID=UPI0015FB8C08|nr:Rap1a/Tai family immunity protein [Comamonas koreensis]
MRDSAEARIKNAAFIVPLLIGVTELSIMGGIIIGWNVMKAIALVLAATLCSLGAHAETYSGNKLFKALYDFKQPTPAGGPPPADAVFDQALGYGYVRGVIDSLNKILFCIPHTVTGGQIVDVVYNHLQDNAKKRHQPAVDLTIEALQDAFPCPPKEGKK